IDGWFKKTRKMNGSSSNEAAAEADQVPLHQTKPKGRKRKEEDPDERKKKKNKRDRDRRAKEKVELQRLKGVEAQFKQMQAEYRELKRKNEELKSMRLNLENQEAQTNQLSSDRQLIKIGELKRLQNVESQWTKLCTEFKQMEEYVKTLRNTTDSLANDNELLKSRVPLLENEIEELTSNLHQKTDELKRLQNAESQGMQPSTQFWKLQEDFTMLRNSNDSLVVMSNLNLVLPAFTLLVYPFSLEFAGESLYVYEYRRGIILVFALA
ncbi:hypothetical protein POUND7_004241, partial [Theobroma cacao]